MPRIADATYSRLARRLAFRPSCPLGPLSYPWRVLTERDRAGGTENRYFGINVHARWNVAGERKREARLRPRSFPDSPCLSLLRPAIRCLYRLVGQRLWRACVGKFVNLWKNRTPRARATVCSIARQKKELQDDVREKRDFFFSLFWVSRYFSILGASNLCCGSFR